VLGSPGGSNIIGYVVNAVVSMIDWKMNPQKAASMPHRINKFGTYYLEKNRNLEKLGNSLKEMNYEVKLTNFLSGLNIIHVNEKLFGGSDHRREGLAIGN
jgi:gamma-glutamyltranspeptidase/glutathione hydrolase